MGFAYRLKRLEGRHAQVDGVRFVMPLSTWGGSSLMGIFPIDWDKARRFLPPGDIHPARLWTRGLLIVIATHHRRTQIGDFIEYTVSIACTQGAKPAPRLLPMIFKRLFGAGQYTFDMPVSSELAVKAGKSIWGMPKRQANLDFVVGKRWVSSQCDLDGRMVYRLDVRRPKSTWLPLKGGGPSYCMYRGMMIKSFAYFSGNAGVHLMRPLSGRFVLGDHPRADPIRALDLDPNPIVCAFVPNARGVLDDYMECWFVTHEKEPAESIGEGLETLSALGHGRDWLTPPQRDPGFNVDAD
jgi:hypothetical protein